MMTGTDNMSNVEWLLYMPSIRAYFTNDGQSLSHLFQASVSRSCSPSKARETRTWGILKSPSGSTLLSWSCAYLSISGSSGRAASKVLLRVWEVAARDGKFSASSSFAGVGLDSNLCRFRGRELFMQSIGLELRRASSMLTVLAQDVVTTQTGVLLDSTILPNISLFGFGCLKFARSSLCSIATENGALDFHLSSTSMSSQVNECAPGSGA